MGGSRRRAHSRPRVGGWLLPHSQPTPSHEDEASGLKLRETFMTSYPPLAQHKHPRCPPRSRPLLSESSIPSSDLALLTSSLETQQMQEFHASRTVRSGGFVGKRGPNTNYPPKREKNCTFPRSLRGHPTTPWSPPEQLWTETLDTRKHTNRKFGIPMSVQQCFYTERLAKSFISKTAVSMTQTKHTQQAAQPLKKICSPQLHRWQCIFHILCVPTPPCRTMNR